ncbi:MAG: hypothetical protein V4643_09550 [Bacteroidota bacterium]
MAKFSEIEKEYLNIKPLNHIELTAFYEKYKELLFNSLSEEDSNYQNTFKILAEIACANSFNENHKEALLLFSKIRPKLKNTQQEYLLLNQIDFCTAQSHFALKNYRLALQHFKRYKPTVEEKNSLDKIKAICKTKLTSKLLFLLALLGVLLIVIKYSISWFFNDYFSQTIGLLSLIGTIFLIPYVVFINWKK